VAPEVLGCTFASIGGSCASVYTTGHFSGEVALVCSFDNAATEHTAGGPLTCCCWLNGRGWSQHPHGDACLAVGGEDRTVSVISVVEAHVVALLRGHAAEVVDLAAPVGDPALASLAADGEVRLWDVVAEVCLFR